MVGGGWWMVDGGRRVAGGGRWTAGGGSLGTHRSAVDLSDDVPHVQQALLVDEAAREDPRYDQLVSFLLHCQTLQEHTIWAVRHGSPRRTLPEYTARISPVRHGTVPEQSPRQTLSEHTARISPVRHGTAQTDTAGTRQDQLTSHHTITDTDTGDQIQSEITS